VIWLNEFQGKITDAEKVFKAVAKKTAGFIVVENKNSDAFTADLEKLTKNRLTLKEALESTDFNLMAKQRLKRVFNDIYAQLDQIYDNAENTAVLEA
ncbi:TPA: conjugal transfer protein TraL, partial [Haemophilus influenzae]